MFKFLPQWRVGFRYSRLHSPELSDELQGTEFDKQRFSPGVSSVMIDWSNSEFSRIRMQYNREQLRSEEETGIDEHGESVHDDQFVFQYIVSIGAHAAHKY